MNFGTHIGFPEISLNPRRSPRLASVVGGEFVGLLPSQRLCLLGHSGSQEGAVVRAEPSWDSIGIFSRDFTTRNGGRMGISWG